MLIGSSNTEQNSQFFKDLARSKQADARVKVVGLSKSFSEEDIDDLAEGMTKHNKSAFDSNAFSSFTSGR